MRRMLFMMVVFGVALGGVTWVAAEMPPATSASTAQADVSQPAKTKTARPSKTRRAAHHTPQVQHSRKTSQPAAANPTSSTNPPQTTVK